MPSLTTTDVEKQEKKIQSLERMLAAVLAVVEVGIVVFDQCGRLVMTNPSFSALFRWKGVSHYSERFSSFFPDAKLPSSMIRLPRSITAGRFATRIRSGDGTLDEVEINARWITHEDGDSFWVATVTPAARDAVPLKATPDALPAAEAPAVACDPDQFEHRAGERIQGSGPDRFIVAGQVEMINLDAIRRAAGDKWSQVASHIFAEAEAIIGQHLSAADTFSHDGAGRFMLCFADATLNGAERQAELIESEIRRRLMGKFGVGAAPDVCSEAEWIALPPGTDRIPDLGSLISGKIARKRTAIAKASAMTLTQVVEAARLETVAVIHASGVPLPDVLVHLDSVTARVLKKTQSLSENADDQAFQEAQLVLGLTVNHIFDGLLQPDLPSFIVPVSFATFTNRRSMGQYLGICRGLPPGVQQHLIFELVGVPADAANVRVEEILALLRPLSRTQYLRLASLHPLPNKTWIRQFNKFSVRYADIEPLSPERAGRVQGCVQTLHQRGGRLLVRDVPSQKAARNLVELGVDTVGGQGLMPWAR